MEITDGDFLFLDSNVLLTATDESRPCHSEARRLLAGAAQHGVHLGASGQIIREYLVVATRPVEVNGLGLSPAAALKNVSVFQERLVLVEETEMVSKRLRQLTRDHQLRGKRIHDANLVATLMCHGLTKLVTQNTPDFGRFENIVTATVDEALKAMQRVEKNPPGAT